MMWRAFSQFRYVSDCGRYEVVGGYIRGAFAWEGRLVDAATLITSSADRTFVELCCEWHAGRAA